MSAPEPNKPTPLAAADEPQPEIYVPSERLQLEVQVLAERPRPPSAATPSADPDEEAA